jgi:hypothetical protein
MFDRAAEIPFRKDASGRVIFLPRGPRQTGYYIDSPADQQKVKALVKLQVVALMCFNLTGFLGSYALAMTWEDLYFIHLPISLGARLLRVAAVYVISALVIQFTPFLVVQKTYQKSLRDICQGLQPAEPGSFGSLSGGSNQYRRVLVALGVVTLLMGAVFAAVARRQVQRRHGAAKATCPPTQPAQ